MGFIHVAVPWASNEKIPSYSEGAEEQRAVEELLAKG
jgi:hypothetical protein